MITRTFFRCGVVELTEQQELELMKKCEIPSLKQLRFSENFPRAILSTRKANLGIILMKLSTAIDTLALKQHVGSMRYGSSTSKLIIVMKDKTEIISGQRKDIINKTLK